MQSIRYVASRRDIWKWYWKMWRNHLWKIHVLFSVILGFVISGSRLSTIHTESWIISSVIVLPLIILVFSLIPQILYKSDERILEFREEGMATTIGDKSEFIPWEQVVEIVEDSENLVIRNKNSNAMIVPNKAFVSNEDKKAIITTIKSYI